METTRLDKLHKNFASEMFDQYKCIKAGDQVRFTVSLYSIKNTSYFYKLVMVDKIAYVERLKAKAGEFYKQGNLAKSAKIYQKINGYFNFGDVNNNYKKETGPEFEQNLAKLMTYKQICFQNLSLCKFKLGEYQSVIAITEQILEQMDENAVKALWLNGRSHEELKEWNQAITSLTRACKCDPQSAEFRKQLDLVKAKKLQEQKKQSSVFSKMLQ